MSFDPTIWWICQKGRFQGGTINKGYMIYVYISIYIYIVVCSLFSGLLPSVMVKKGWFNQHNLGFNRWWYRIRMKYIYILMGLNQWIVGLCKRNGSGRRRCPHSDDISGVPIAEYLHSRHPSDPSPHLQQDSHLPAIGRGQGIQPWWIRSTTSACGTPSKHW